MIKYLQVSPSAKSGHGVIDLDVLVIVGKGAHDHGGRAHGGSIGRESSDDGRANASHQHLGSFSLKRKSQTVKGSFILGLGPKEITLNP